MLTSPAKSAGTKLLCIEVQCATRRSLSSLAATSRDLIPQSINYLVCISCACVMPSCAVYGCTNYNKKTRYGDVRYHRFPLTIEFQRKWLAACGRSDNVNVKNATICSHHFADDEYFTPLKCKLLNYSPVNFRYLKREAVPTLNLPEVTGITTGNAVSSSFTLKFKTYAQKTPLNNRVLRTQKY